jgi:creatinine amidohydrolase
MENFPWTRLADVVQPDARKAPINADQMRILSPREVRDYLGDGNFAGLYQRPDEDMLALWEVAVDETRTLLTDGW